MPLHLTPDRLAAYLRPGCSVYWPGCAGHSSLFEAWLKAAPEMADGVDFSGVWIPGVNDFDPTALHPQARATAYFLPRSLRAGWQRGAVDYRPWHYSEIARHFATTGLFDVLMLQVAPPDDNGLCSLSLAADFTPTVLQAVVEGGGGDSGGSRTVVLAHVNPDLPRTHGPAVAVQAITAWVHQAAPLLTVADTPPDAALQAVAQQVAKWVRDGDTLQFGLGRLQAATLAALRSHRQLKLHSGMVSDGLLGLLQSGALAPTSRSRPPVCTGAALGSRALYAAMADAALVRFAPVSHTHAHATLAALPRLVAINSAIEIDLLGQVNCEWLHGQQVSGVGGLVDFVRGARASAGGRAIVAATATVGHGAGSQSGSQSGSRIVPLLAPAAVGLARSDTDTVVTEHGVAALRHLGVQARAQALIAVAAPEHRDALQQAWHTLRRTL